MSQWLDRMRIQRLNSAPLRMFLLLLTSLRLLEAQGFDRAEELSAELLSRLQIAPALAVASFYGSRWMYGLEVQVDTTRHSVRYKESSKGGFTEVLCDRIEDGLRRTIPGSKRIEIRSQCAMKDPRSTLLWKVLVEKEDGKTYTEMSDATGNRYFVGTLLPTVLPNSIPEFSGSSIKLEQIFGKQVQAPRENFQIYIKLRSTLRPEDFMKAFTMNGELKENRDGFARWERLISGQSVQVTQLSWSPSNGETVYYLTTRQLGFDDTSNRPASSIMSPSKKR